MNLLIISHTPHYRRGGAVVGWGPTVREIDYLAQLFARVVHVAPLHSEAAPESAIAYESPRVEVRPVPPAGGERLADKFNILFKAPGYISAIWRELKHADMVHVRCPANISMLAILLLALVRSPRRRWVKYAGNWRPDAGEPQSYRFQRWWLTRGRHRGVVTINGRWPEQPPHVHSFLNPCLTDAELRDARVVAAEKSLSAPLQLLLVGRIEKAKGVHRALQVLARLRELGVAARLDLVGDGPERGDFERQAEKLGVAAQVVFHGWLPRGALAPIYSRAHILIFPSDTEGWPKVLSEAMAYGAVPVCSAVSGIPQALQEFGTGRTFAPDDVEGFARAIAGYAAHPDVWKKESLLGVKAAALFSYSHYLQAVQRMLDLKK